MADPRALAESFVEEVRKALGDRLRAALLFGSAARGEWIEGTSDVNVLVLTDSLSAALLARAAPAARTAMAQGVTPLLMEQEEWRRAADVFAIELADMQQTGVPLFGAHPAASTELDPRVLRLQAERELRAKLLHLHGGMLIAADDPARLGALLRHALPSFTTYMRTVLRLSGQDVPPDSRSVIQSACAVAGADPAPFLTVLDARTRGNELRAELSDGSLADTFNTAAGRFATWLDTFDGVTE